MPRVFALKCFAIFKKEHCSIANGRRPLSRFECLIIKKVCRDARLFHGGSSVLPVECARSHVLNLSRSPRRTQLGLARRSILNERGSAHLILLRCGNNSYGSGK